MQTMKARGLCAAFSLALLIFLASAANAASWLDEADVSWYEEGQSRFVISTEAQLAGLTKLVDEGNGFEDKTIFLSGDLNLEGKEWTPIGTGEKPFLGSLEGRGALIQLDTPLFGMIGRDGKAGTICGVNLSGDIRSREGVDLCGALAEGSFGTIRNCSFTGSFVVGSSSEGMAYLGGLVGLSWREHEISECRVQARLAAENVGDVYMGGIVGSTNGPIRNCSFEGEFHRCVKPGVEFASDFGFFLGGIAAMAMTGTVQDCQARFSVSFSGEMGETGIGGIAGGAVSLENCLAEWTVSEDRSLNVGGIVHMAEESVKNCVFKGDVTVGGDGNIGGILGGSEDYTPFVGNCFVRGRLSGGATIGGVAGVNAGEIRDCSAVCEVLPGAGATAGALVGDNQGTVSGCSWVSGLGPDDAVGNGEAPEGSGAVASESALPATSVVLTPFLGMLEGGTETVRAEVYPDTAYNKGSLSFAWTAEGTVLNIVSPNAETTEIEALKKGTAALKLSCGGLPGGEPLTPVISVLIRGLLPDPVSPDVPGPVSPDVPGPVSPDIPGPVSPDVGWIASADVSWYDAGQTEFTISTEEQLAGLAKLVNGGNTFEDKTVRLDADLSLVERNWTPIGSGASAGSVEKRFRGTFDGQGHLIRIKSPLFDGIGSVGGGNNVGTVLNVNLSGDVSLVFNSNGQQTVGVLAREACGTIRNCSFTGSISIEKTGEDSSVTLGGLVGYYGASNKDTEELSDCRVRARMAVKGKKCHVNMGGIVSNVRTGTVRNCVFEGELFADTELLDPGWSPTFALGGIVQGGNVTIKDCRSRFSVSLGETRFYSLTMGGIAGNSSRKNIENCLAEWTVSEDCWVNKEASIGGIVGIADGITIQNCAFDGKLAVGSDSVIALGGIYGVFWGNVNTYNCFARGRLSGGRTVGGVAGKATGTIENSSAACKIETGPNAVSGALVGDNAGAVKECRWVSGLGSSQAVGGGTGTVVNTDAVASESDLPATSVVLVPLLGLTENRGTSVRAEVYPASASSKGSVSFSWTTADKDVLNIASPNMETAVLKGLKEGTAGLKLSSSGLLGGTTYNPTSFVTVRRVRLESLSLSPGNIELSQKGQRAEIRAEIRPGAEVASFPQCDWSFKVVEGASAEADDIELTPAANGLGATVTLSRPVSGAKYRIVASAVDGSGLSDDVIVTVKYVSPVPLSPDVSPDVSPDIPAPLSPDVPAPVSPDIEVPEAPEKGVAPRLPDKAPAGVGSSKPEFFKGKETSALKSAADALSDSGLTERDLTFDADTGVVRLQSRVVREVAGKVLPSGSTLRRVRTLPVLSAVLPQGANVAAVGLELTGTELLSKKASEVKLLKATGPDTGALLNWAGSPEEFGDGCFTVLDSGGGVVEELKLRVRYVLTVFIKDGGKYDLDGEVNGRVVDPLALLSVTGGSEPGPSPQPEPEGRDSGGGCDAGFLWSWLLLLAAVPVALWRRG